MERTGGSSAVHVLLVDDNLANLKALEKVLSELDQELLVSLARSGREALRQLLDKEFAVIVLDVNMPDMDGFETAQLIRQRPRSEHTPIIFVTAYGSSEFDILTGYRLGAVDFLYRPINPDIMRSKVATFVQLFQARQQGEAQAEQMASLNWQLEARLADLQHLHLELKNTNAELEALTYSVSHDLRAPASTALVWVDALTEEVRVSGRCNWGHLQSIRDNMCRLLQIVEGLLELSRISLAPLQKTSVDLTRLAGEVTARLAQAEPERQVSVSISQGMTAQGDASLLRLALESLLGEAWHAALVPEARIEMGIVQDHEEHDLVFYVQDNRAAFGPDLAERLLRPSQRLVHAAADFTGSGMRLAKLERIVRRHGGKVWAEVSPPSGARIFFTLES